MFKMNVEYQFFRWLICALLSMGLLPNVSHAGSDVQELLAIKVEAQDPKNYGELINRGKVYKLDSKHTDLLFTYDRRVKQDGLLQISTSYTYDANQVALIQVATHDHSYKLNEYFENQYQLGELGSMKLIGTTAAFRLVKNGVEKLAQESVSLPVVVGPTLVGFVYQHWEKLMAGEVVDFRFAVMSRLETVGFSVQKVTAPNQQIRIQMKASSMLIALAVDPIYITFTADRRLLSIEGRVPTKLKQGNKWVDLDAYVEYHNEAGNFR